MAIPIKRLQWSNNHITGDFFESARGDKGVYSITKKWNEKKFIISFCDSTGHTITIGNVEYDVANVGKSNTLVTRLPDGTIFDTKYHFGCDGPKLSILKAKAFCDNYEFENYPPVVKSRPMEFNKHDLLELARETRYNLAEIEERVTRVLYALKQTNTTNHLEKDMIVNLTEAKEFANKSYKALVEMAGNTE